MHSFGGGVFNVEAEDTSFCGPPVLQSPPLPVKWPSSLVTCLGLEVFEFLTATLAQAFVFRMWEPKLQAKL